MNYSTSIPFLMRKKNISYSEAQRLVKNLTEDGLICPSLTFKEEEITLKLLFRLEGKYGRFLFYPSCEESEFIVRNLLFQKTATKNQIDMMLNHGWDVLIQEKQWT